MLQFYIVYTLVVIFYEIIKYRYTYFRRKGILHKEPSIPFGNINKFNFNKDLAKIYSIYKRNNECEPFVGAYIHSTPTIITNELNFLVDYLINEQNYFKGNGPCNMLKNQDQILIEFFSADKLEIMFPIIKERAQNLSNIVKQRLELEQSIKMKPLLDGLSTEVMARLAFGLETNCLKDSNDPFQECSKNILIASKHNMFIKRHFRFLFKALGFNVNCNFEDFMKNIIEKKHCSMETYPNDFLDILIKIKKSENSVSLSDNEIIKLVCEFYSTCFEISMSTVLFTLLELAQNLDVQNTARKEIVESLGGTDLTWNNLEKMKYLDNIVTETFRKHSPVIYLLDKAREDHVVSIPRDFTLETGTSMLIPIKELLSDSHYFPEPEKFIPDRHNLCFDGAKKHLKLFLGLDNCLKNGIYLKFARLQTKIILSSFLSEFELHVSDKFKMPIKLNKSGQLLEMKNELWLRIKEIQN